LHFRMSLSLLAIDFLPHILFLDGDQR